MSRFNLEHYAVRLRRINREEPFHHDVGKSELSEADWQGRPLLPAFPELRSTYGPFSIACQTFISKPEPEVEAAVKRTATQLADAIEGLGLTVVLLCEGRNAIGGTCGYALTRDGTCLFSGHNN